jgi:hypothetical protein
MVIKRIDLFEMKIDGVGFSCGYDKWWCLIIMKVRAIVVWFLILKGIFDPNFNFPLIGFWWNLY